MTSPGALDTATAVVQRAQELAQTRWDEVDGPEAVAIAETVAAAKGLLDAALLRTAERITDTNAIAEIGWASVKDFLTHLLGGHKGTGGGLVRALGQLRELPNVQEALEDGRISLPQVRAIASASLVLVLTGCGKDDAEPPVSVTSSTTPTATPAPTPTTLPTSSITCSSPKPEGPFTYSTDREELEALAPLIGDPVVFDSTFDDFADADELGLLIERGFVDPEGDTNGSPSMWEFHQLLCKHPEVRADIGFIAGTLPGDEQAIASLQTVYADVLSDELRKDARAFCRSTPDRTLRGHLDCFWTPEDWPRPPKGGRGRENGEPLLLLRPRHQALAQEAGLLNRQEAGLRLDEPHQGRVLAQRLRRLHEDRALPGEVELALLARLTAEHSLQHRAERGGHPLGVVVVATANGQSAQPSSACGSARMGGSTKTTGPLEAARNLPVPISVTKPGTIDCLSAERRSRYAEQVVGPHGSSGCRRRGRTSCTS